MLSDEVIDKVIDRIVIRIEEGNTYVLKKMGESVKKLKTLTPTQAQQLAQIMYYGGDYQKIANELARITELNVKDIYKIFEEVAKNDYMFAKQFYKYRNIKYIPYEKNIALQNQVQAIANLTATNYVNITRTMGFAIKQNGKIVFTDMARTYQNLLDKAVLSAGQGKTTFDEEMYNTIKNLASSGIKTIDYMTNRKLRVDSAVRMAMQDGLRNLHNETQRMFGQEFNADGVEISVHINPAPDHENVQGKQFSNEEFDNFQNDLEAVSYDGEVFPPEFEGHDRRSISQYNCYHYIFSIILGISKPQHTKQELQEIREKNDKGFDYEGKHYTMYEGTQLQRQIETEIRKQKDIQIIAKAEENDNLIRESQDNITKLTKKYKELNAISGLKSKLERARVSGYKRTKINK